MSKLRTSWTDITKVPVDVIVNAANSRLLGGGGVDGAIHRAAGRELLEECRGLGGCQVGEAKITKAYNIKTAKNIIHTVGPQIYDDDLTDEDKTDLRNCYWNSLELAKKHDLKSIAFPCISTGVYSFPPKQACNIAVGTTNEWLKKNPDMESVVFCCFMKEDYQLYKQKLGIEDQTDESEPGEEELEDFETFQKRTGLDDKFELEDKPAESKESVKDKNNDEEELEDFESFQKRVGLDTDFKLEDEPGATTKDEFGGMAIEPVKHSIKDESQITNIKMADKNNQDESDDYEPHTKKLGIEEPKDMECQKLA